LKLKIKMLLHEKKYIEDILISWILNLMFKNLDRNSDTEAGHTHSGRSFINIPLANLFKHSYGSLAQDEGFYNGEEAEQSDKEYSEFARVEEVETEEPC
jgi:hypothetical protein